MALFGKKDLSLDEILKAIDNLPDEEKAQVKAKMDDLYKAEDEREIDKVEEEKADDTEVADEKADEVKEESEEIGDDVDAVKDDVDEPVNDDEKVDEAVEEPTETPTEETEVDEVAEDNKDEIISKLTDRVSSLEEKLNKFDDVMAQLDAMNKKMADKFGYTGGLGTPKKDYDDMTADEMKKHLIQDM